MLFILELLTQVIITHLFRIESTQRVANGMKWMITLLESLTQVRFLKNALEEKTHFKDTTWFRWSLWNGETLTFWSMRENWQAMWTLMKRKLLLRLLRLRKMLKCNHNLLSYKILKIKLHMKIKSIGKIDSYLQMNIMNLFMMLLSTGTLTA